MGGLHLPVVVSFSTVIPFDEPFTSMGQHTVTGPLTFTADLSDPQEGFTTAMTLIADGANVPNFGAFQRGGSTTYDNTAGKKNQVLFYYLGGEACYAVSVLNAATGLTTLNVPGSFNATAIDDTEIDLTWADTNSSPNESGYTIYFNGINDFGSASVLATPAADATSYNHTGLSASSTFYYWIKANGDGTTTADSATATDSATTTGAGSYDADAQALYDANSAGGGSTIPTPQKQAWSDFIDGLQTDGLYTKFPLATPASSMHPMLGSTLSSQKWNHCDPVDADASYRLSGTATHDAVGAKFNGTTQFLDTHVPVNAFAFSAGTIIFYVAVRNNVSNGYFGGFISAFNTGLIGVCATPEASNSITALNAYGFFCVKTPSGLTPFNPVGLWIITRDASGNGEVYHEGNLIDSDTGFNADQGVTTSLYIGGLNKEGVGLYNPSDCKIGFRATCPNHFTSGDVAAFQARWNTFKTAASK